MEERAEACPVELPGGVGAGMISLSWGDTGADPPLNGDAILKDGDLDEDRVVAFNLNL